MKKKNTHTHTHTHTIKSQYPPSCLSQCVLYMTFTSKSFCQLIKCQPRKSKWQVLADKKGLLWEEMNCWIPNRTWRTYRERGIGSWKEHRAVVLSQSIVVLVYQLGLGYRQQRHSSGVSCAEWVIFTWRFFYSQILLLNFSAYHPFYIHSFTAPQRICYWSEFEIRFKVRILSCSWFYSRCFTVLPFFSLPIQPPSASPSPLRWCWTTVACPSAPPGLHPYSVKLSSRVGAVCQERERSMPCLRGLSCVCGSDRAVSIWLHQKQFSRHSHADTWT